jgi:lipid-A-disaccharide synthase-like uncharacterized protein
MTTSDGIWLAIGFAGQAAFTSRFFLQWIRSELEGRSIVPSGFWYLSLLGSSILLAYAIHRRDLVFTLGQGGGLLIYLRNLQLLRRQAGRSETPAGASAGS